MAATLMAAMDTAIMDTAVMDTAMAMRTTATITTATDMRTGMAMDMAAAGVMIGGIPGVASVGC